MFIALFLHLPEIRETPAEKERSTVSPYRYPHLMFGAVAIFVYMGVEIGIPSFYLTECGLWGLILSVFRY